MAEAGTPIVRIDAKDCGNSMRFRSATPHPNAMRRAMEMIAVAAVSVRKGEIKLTLEVGANETDVKSYCKFRSNRVMDIMLSVIMSSEQRRFCCTITRKNQELNAEAQQRKENTYELMQACIIMEYMLKGSLDALRDGSHGITEHFWKLSDIPSSDYRISKLSTVSQMYKLDFKNYIIHPQMILPAFGAETRARFLIGSAGNRFFKMIRAVDTFAKFENTDNPVLVLLAKISRKMLYPYISFHPDHPLNPFDACNDYLYAHLGEYINKKNIEMNKIELGMAQTLKWNLTEKLNMNPAFISQVAPDLNKIKAAAQPALSYRELFKACPSVVDW